MIKIPHTDNLVLINNKYEEIRLLEREELRKKENNQLKPLAVMPEEDVDIYSRCIVC